MKDDRVYLLHVQDAIVRIRGYCSVGRDAFHADLMVQDAVLRNLEVIGEAVKNLSEGSKTARPDIPWKRIGGMRDKLIHQYFGVNLRLVWDTVTQDLPRLEAAVADLLAST